jgi:hypothetical protein
VASEGSANGAESDGERRAKDWRKALATGKADVGDYGRIGVLSEERWRMSLKPMAGWGLLRFGILFRPCWQRAVSFDPKFETISTFSV